MPDVLEAPPETVVLRNVSWNTYESFLRDSEDRHAPRLAFDRGVLEIMSPTARHEKLSRLIDLLVGEIAEEWDIECVAFGSATFKRADLESGFEPDSCYYVQNAAAMFGADEIDLARGDLPPDLIVEIEVTTPALPKLPLFARVGVSEVWRLDKAGRATFHILDGDEYVTTDISAAFPRLRSDAILPLLSASPLSGLVAWRRHVRKWAREQA